MSKKGKGNAENPADNQPQTVSTAVPPAAMAPETETALALGSGDTAAAAGDEHASAPDAAAADNSAGHSGGVGDGESSDTDPATESADGLSDAAGATGTTDVPADAPGERLSAADTAHFELGASDAAGSDGDVAIEAGAASEIGGATLDPAALAGAGGETNHVDDPMLSPIDGIVVAAEEACASVIYYLTEFWEFDQEKLARLAILAGAENSKATNAVAELVRRIGKERATPAVCGQQLKILKLIDDPELSDVETLIVVTFIDVLTGIEAFERAEVARLAAEAAVPVERTPIPIDETTMGLVDDTLDTFGGQG